VTTNGQDDGAAPGPADHPHQDHPHQDHPHPDHPQQHGGHHLPPHLAEQLAHLEHRMAEFLVSVEQTGRATAANTGRLVPAWRRVTEGEHRLPVTLAVLGMIGMQAGVPEHLSFAAWWVLPVIEVAILVVLVGANPRRVTHTSRRLRVLSLMLIAIASLANAWSAGSLVVGLVHGTEGEDAGTLLITGANIWLTNIVIFGLWYWDLDRGGPGSRARAEKNRPDFLFPEMTAPELAAADWEPHFVDYLYLAFTNATAFSPTDTLPFSRWSKLAMMLQSAISLSTGALVIARAVNILK
jgi:uncharacterized membrane protein